MSSSRIDLSRVAGVRVRKGVRPQDGGPQDPPPREGGPPQRAAAGQSSVHRVALPMVGVKELQRRAFERGQEVEREAGAARIRAALAELAQARDELLRARESEACQSGSFAVELACAIAEELVGRLVAEDRHDARRMARRVLETAAKEHEGGEVVLRAHPEDLSRLGPSIGEVLPDVSVRLVAEPRLPRGAFEVDAGDVELHADVAERLAAMRRALLDVAADAQDAQQEGGPDGAGP